MPIIFMVVFSFNESRYSNAFTGFSLKWYRELFKDESVMKVFGQTLIITAIATVFALIIGTLGAWSIYKAFSPKLKTYFTNVSYIPLILPDIVSHIIFNVPFVVFAILPKLLTFDKSLFDAGTDLGARQFQVFRRIVLPQLIPNIIIASLVCITLSLDDFTVSYFTSGNGVATLSVKIYSMTKRGISPKINALSTLLFAIIILISTITYLFKKRGEKNEKN